MFGGQLERERTQDTRKMDLLLDGRAPEIKSYAQVSLDERTANNQHVGVIVTRLLTDNCAASLKRAYSSDTNSVRKAFEFVGRVAMQELMASPEVAKSISDYAQFADLKSINKALSK